MKYDVLHLEYFSFLGCINLQANLYQNKSQNPNMTHIRNPSITHPNITLSCVEQNKTFQLNLCSRIHVKNVNNTSSSVDDRQSYVETRFSDI